MTTRSCAPPREPASWTRQPPPCAACRGRAASRLWPAQQRLLVPLAALRPSLTSHTTPGVARRSIYDKRLAAEIEGEDIGDEFKGYVFKIAGGQDKQGFSMKQGVLTTDRVKLMMAKGEPPPVADTAHSTQRERHTAVGRGHT